MVIVDSHCHLDKIDLNAFGGSIESMLTHANQLDVKKFLCVCINLENFADVLNIAKNHPNIYASVGIHPTEILQQEPSIEQLLKLAKDEKIVAIGETGLDYFHCDKKEVDWQRERFVKHIEVAKQTKKPLIIHCRAAKDDTLAIIENEQAPSGVMHCFVEDWQTAKKAMDCGFFISFSGIVTFKNATDLQTIAKKVPDEFLLVETDSPYLTPMPYRGKANTPAYTHFVAQKIAELRGTTLAHIADITTRNFNRLFLDNCNG